MDSIYLFLHRRKENYNNFVFVVVLFWGHTQWYSELTRNSGVIPRIEPGLTKCKTSILIPVVSLWLPENSSFSFCNMNFHIYVIHRIKGTLLFECIY